MRDGRVEKVKEWTNVRVDGGKEWDGEGMV